jgi:UDP-glucose 4-epimerase
MFGGRDLEIEYGKKLVLLLGGSGYIGTHLMLQIHTGNYQVGIIDIRPPNPEATAYANQNHRDGVPVLYWQVDLMSNPVSYPILPTKPYCAIMLAAKKDVNEGEIERHQYLLDNTTMCINSMRYLSGIGVKRIIQASSSTVYHTLLNGTFENLEDEDYGDPIGTYGYSKKITEDMCRRLIDHRRQDLVILRYMNPIGSHPVVNAFPDIGICTKLTKMEEGSVLENYGDCIRDYIHIMDLASYHFWLIRRWDKIFEEMIGPSLILNVGSGARVSTKELVEIFSKHAGLGKRFSTLADKKYYEGKDTVGDMKKSFKYLPEWFRKPLKSLEDSVADYARLKSPVKDWSVRVS